MTKDEGRGMRMNNKGWGAQAILLIWIGIFLTLFLIVYFREYPRVREKSKRMQERESMQAGKEKLPPGQK